MTTSLSERLVERASGLFSSRQSRRSFLAKTAVVGSALAVNPFGFILRPGTAYGAVCGTCSDGWTAFCCTINSGQNSCPAGSFVGGWWKADNAAYCCGAARYMIDCNASCPTSCSCRCSGASCDGRRTCCNQFRYGQCHQEIACYGPVVCRVATCVPPWQYDKSCTSTSATDNATVTHGAPCLPDQCGTPIAKLYASLGGSSGVLGPVTRAEQEVAYGTGRYALYAHGCIFEKGSGTPYAVLNPIAARYATLEYYRGPLGYPVSNQGAIGDAAKGIFNRFEDGVIYSASATGTWEVVGPIRTLHSSLGGVKGALGYPTTGQEAVGDALAGVFNRFQGGVIYSTLSTGAHEVLGKIRTLHSSTGGVKGPLGYPTTGQIDWPANTGDHHQTFQHGTIWQSFGGGTHWMSGATNTRFVGLGGPSSALGWPTSDPIAVDHGTINRFQHGAIYASRLGAFDLEGPIQAKYVALGEMSSSLGVPTAEPTTSGTVTTAQFQFGTLSYDSTTGIVTQG